MDRSVAESLLDVIRSERDRRVQTLRRILEEDDDPYVGEAADTAWMFRDGPLVNELCLLLMVWIRHQVERELVWLAGRVTNDGRELSADEHREQVEEWRMRVWKKGRAGWKQLAETLGLEDMEEWRGAMETLRLMGNLFKHDPWSSPDEELLAHLRSELERQGEEIRPFAKELLEHLRERPTKDREERQPFQELGRSPDLMRGLAASLKLEEPTDYCEIAGTFLARADEFLKDVQTRAAQRANWSQVKLRGLNSADPQGFAR